MKQLQEILLSLKILKETAEDLTRTADFINNIESWGANGSSLSPSTIKEIEKYLAENDTIGKLIDSAMELAIKEGDSTLMGKISERDHICLGWNILNDYKGLIRFKDIFWIFS